MSQKNPTYLVLGAGEVGPAIAHWLLRQQDTRDVVLADADGQRARQAVHRIDPTGRAPIAAAELDVNTDDRVTRAEFAGFDCVVSAIPASYSPSLAPLAVGAGAHFIDLGGVTRISRQLRADKKLTENPYRSVIHDCGWAPGLSGQLTQLLNCQLPGARRIITYVGGLPQRPQERAFYWQRTFSAKGLVELLGPAFVLRNGKLTDDPACSGGVTLDIPALISFGTEFGSRVHTRVTAGAGLTPEIMKDRGVKDCWEETIRWSWTPFLHFIQGVPEDRRVPTLEERLPHTSREFPDVGVMRVVATTDDGATVSYEMVLPYDTELGMSAMAKATGFSAAAVARCAALGATRPGVRTPEELPGAVTSGIIDRLAPDLNIRLIK